MRDIPTLEDIRGAAARIAPFVQKTPVLSSSAIDRITGGRIFFKCENFQRIGAFKIRGAVNAINGLSEAQLKHGVATHSSGNHAAAVALAASIRHTPAYTVMPDNAPRVKQDAVAGYGAEIILCEPTLSAREQVLSEVISKTGAEFIHPYDNVAVIEGQATAALELLDEVPDLDLVMTPIGGGGLISGTALALRGLSPQTRVIGAEPAGADFACRSFKSGTLVRAANAVSIADGLLSSLSERTFTILKQHVDDVVTVDDEQITRAMRTLWERMKIIVEPSASVPLAAIFCGKVDVAGLNVGIILTGGNVDLDRLPWMKAL